MIYAILYAVFSAHFPLSTFFWPLAPLSLHRRLDIHFHSHSPSTPSQPCKLLDSTRALLQGTSSISDTINTTFNTLRLAVRTFVPILQPPSKLTCKPELVLYCLANSWRRQARPIMPLPAPPSPHIHTEVTPHILITKTSTTLQVHTPKPAITPKRISK
jgi:hypothetical protein